MVLVLLVPQGNALLRKLVLLVAERKTFVLGHIDMEWDMGIGRG
jgi:hypothetical protein